MTDMEELLAHLVGDYIVQTDFLAEQKTYHKLHAAIHAGTYAACFLPLTRSWKVLAVISGTHFVIDHWRLARYVNWFKNQFAPQCERPGLTPTGYPATKPEYMAVWLMIIADNTMHMLINHWALRRLR